MAPVITGHCHYDGDNGNGYRKFWIPLSPSFIAPGLICTLLNWTQPCAQNKKCATGNVLARCMIVPVPRADFMNFAEELSFVSLVGAFLQVRRRIAFVLAVCVMSGYSLVRVASSFFLIFVK